MKIRKIEKVIFLVFFVCLIISNIFLVLEFKYRYINFSEVYNINQNVDKIILYNKVNDKYIKIEDKCTIDKIYQKLGNLKVRDRYTKVYINLYDRKKHDSNIYFNIYEKDINNSRYITIYNKLIIIDGKSYVCDMNIADYIKSVSDI